MKKIASYSNLLNRTIFIRVFIMNTLKEENFADDQNDFFRGNLNSRFTNYVCSFIVDNYQNTRYNSSKSSAFLLILSNYIEKSKIILQKSHQLPIFLQFTKIVKLRGNLISRIDNFIKFRGNLISRILAKNRENRENFFL